jgi:hypothetical protein
MAGQFFIEIKWKFIAFCVAFLPQGDFVIHGKEMFFDRNLIKTFLQ